VLLLFTTTSSPLFAFNGWVDVNAYFTVGKGLFNGYVPYVDLIDHKGPFVYFLFGIAWSIDNTGFFGVYLLQSIFLSISVIHVFRLAKLYVKRNDLCFVAAIVSPLPMLSIGNQGASVEEFVLALLTVSFYYIALYFMQPESFKLRYISLLGGLCAAVLLMKFNLVVFFAGFILVIICERLYKKQFGLLGKYVVCFAAGASVILLPFLIYMLATNSVRAFIDIYIKMNNLYSGGGERSIGIRLILGLSNAVQVFNGRLVSAAFIIAGLVFTVMKTKTEYMVGNSISLVLLMIFVCFGPIFVYTHIPLTVFIHMGIIALCSIPDKHTSVIKIGKAGKYTIVCLVFMLIIGKNGLVKWPMFLRQIVPVQQQMAEIIWHHARDDSTTLLQVGSLDSGFYTASGIIPNEPFFYTPNISHALFPEIRDGQRDAVRRGDNEFVIIHTGAEDERPNENHWWLGKNYVHLTVLHGAGANDDRWFHLYQRILFPDAEFDNMAQNKIVNIESNSNNNFSALFDGNPDTFWDTGRSPEAGDYLMFEFSQAVNYDCLLLDQGSRINDYPRSLSIFTSQDGALWQDVPHSRYGWHFYHLQTEAYRFLKIESNGSDEKNWWSINAINFGIIK